MIRIAWFGVLVSIPLLAPAEEPEDGSSLVRRSGEHIALELAAEHWAILEDPDAWIADLDRAYEAYTELVGGTPYGGETITIRAVQEYPGGWAVAGNPIKWHARYVAESLRKVNEGDTLFGILHEIGHDFDLNYRWVWNAEFFANFKMVYVLDETGLRVRMNEIWYDHDDPETPRIDRYYERDASGSAVAHGADGDRPMRDWFNDGDAATHKFLRLVREFGWEPFQATFRTFETLPEEALPGTHETKLALFIHILSEHCGEDLWDRFETWGFPVIRPVRARAGDSAEDFGRMLREHGGLFEDLKLAGFRRVPRTREVEVRVEATPEFQATRGLRSHSNARIVYDLAPRHRYRTFESLIYPRGGGTVSFRVLADDEVRFDSGNVKLGNGDIARPIRVEIAGVRRLVLEITDGGDGISWDAADWVNARLVRSDGQATALDDLRPMEATQDWGEIETGKHHGPWTIRGRGFPDGEVSIEARIGGRSGPLSPSDEPGLYQGRVRLDRDLGGDPLVLVIRRGPLLLRRFHRADTLPLDEGE